MTDMTAFESLIAEDVRDEVGPEESVDALAVARQARVDSTRWRFGSMFSAAKFVAAAAIVALFGGFLLAGVLTTQQGDEMTPGAVTESHSPMTSEQLLSGMVTEEVEPGVYKVVNDGVRDVVEELALRQESDHPWWKPMDYHEVVAGLDGSVWVIDGDGFYRLGMDGIHDWPGSYRFGMDSDSRPWPLNDLDFDVAPDGTVWLDDVGWGNEGSERCVGGFYSFDGESWTESHDVDDRSMPDCWRHDLALGADGSVVISRDVLGEGVAIERRTAEGWERLGEPLAGLDPATGLFVTDDGEVWFERRSGDNGLVRNVDGEWQVFAPLDDQPLYRPGGSSHQGPYVGPDGAVWLLAERGRRNGDEWVEELVLARHDGTDWREWRVPEGLSLWPPNQMEPATDGRLWLAQPSIGWWGFTGPPGDVGLVHWDGSTWRRFLPNSVIASMDIAPDGTAWVLGTASGEPDDVLRGYIYAITPEAVAGTE